jgi:hypothetical protein
MKHSIVALANFIEATRDSGYRSIGDAVSELVDNSIEAGAGRIAIRIDRSSNGEPNVDVLDDGKGMNRDTLRLALRFGGTTRFGCTNGLGRFGMGLPNASLSHARRVSVYSRAATEQSPTLMSYLDVDEILQDAEAQVPSPRRVGWPRSVGEPKHGTLVVWTKCDRLKEGNLATTSRRVAVDLGRRYRRFLSRGLRITLNDSVIAARDPLFLEPPVPLTGAIPYGQEMAFEMATEPGSKETGWVRIRFSELPVKQWSGLSNDEKRARGITRGGGVSVLRSEREVAYGWFFMGTKPRENYDDWWRCEVAFDPILDTAFGITHTKQEIHPQPHLLEVLTPPIEAAARALNGRVRRAFSGMKASSKPSEEIAARQDNSLRPLPRLPRKSTPRDVAAGARFQGIRYLLRAAELNSQLVYEVNSDRQTVDVVINTAHPFYRDVYLPLRERTEPARKGSVITRIELCLLAAARSEFTAHLRKKDRERFKLEWSQSLAAFLNAV